MKAFTVMGRVLKATYEELFLCIYLSLFWWLGTLLVVTAAPATMGVQRVANRMANYKRVDNSFFWEAARQHIGRGWVLYLLNLLAPVMIFFNALFYSRVDGYWQIFAVFWLWAFVISLMIGQYVFPLLWQQDEPDARLAIRNAALLALRHPLYSFLMLLFQLILTAISIGLTLPLLILAPAMVAISGNFALAGLLQEMGMAPEPPEVPRR